MSFIFMLLLFIATFILSELLRPSPNEDAAQPAGLGDFRFPTATENRAVPLIWGTVKITGPNVVWYGDIAQEAITQEAKTGLFSSETFTVGFRYFVGVQFAWCRGPIDNLRRIWIGEEVVFTGSQGAGSLTIDEPNLFGGDDLGLGGVVGTFSVFIGDEAQAASAYLSDFQKEPPTTGDTPAYRGTAYGVFEQGNIGNSTTIKPWAFEVRRIPNGLGLTGDELVNGADANPANVLYELLTNDEWGLNFPAADIDLTNFIAVSAILATEGNGFSMILDRPTEMLELLRIIERQIDGLVLLNRLTGKWEINLVRDDYDIDTVPQVTSSSLISVDDFTRGAWEDTVNHVRISFNDRARDYMGTFSQAQDMANVRVQGGANVSVTATYPGIKDAALANNTAWRDLRSLSIPLAKAKLVVDRTFFDVQPGDVVAFTGSIDDVTFTKLPLRIAKIDLGQLDEGKIILDVVQDVFKFAQPSFGDPPPTGWEPPEDQLGPFPATEQTAFESPYGLIARDPVFPGQRHRAWTSGRNQNDGAVVYDVQQRNDTSPPAGAFAFDSTISAFMLKAQLTALLSKSPSTWPSTVNILITAGGAGESTKAAIQDAIGTFTAQDVGLNLTHLCMVGDPIAGDPVEFIAFQTEGTDPGGNDVRLTAVYRGLMDTTPKDHAAGTPIFLLFAGGNLTGAFPEFNDVDIRLLPRSTSDQVAGGSATIMDLFFDRRDKKPIAPTRITLDGVVFATTDDLDSGGGGLDNRGAVVGYTRRDWRSPDDVEALDTDASLIQADFPAFNSTRYRMRVINDPDGTPVTLFTTVFNAGEATIDLERERVLRETDGVQPTRMRVEIEVQHDFVDPPATNIDGFQLLRHDFDVTFSIIGSHFNTGARDSSVTSLAYTAPTTGTYTFTIGSDVLTGGAEVQAQINGGGFVAVITAGNTVGTLVGVTAADTIEWRHTQSTGFDETFLEIDAPGSASDAYGILIGD